MSMVKAINPARLQFTLEFGKYEPTGQRNPNTGKVITEFNPHFQRWAGQFSLTETQAVTLAGTGIKDAIVFFVRHDASITSEYHVRKQEQIYKIDNVAYDDGLPPDGFDLITCHREVVNHA